MRLPHSVKKLAAWAVPTAGLLAYFVTSFDANQAVLPYLAVGGGLFFVAGFTWVYVRGGRRSAPVIALWWAFGVQPIAWSVGLRLWSAMAIVQSLMIVAMGNNLVPYRTDLEQRGRTAVTVDWSAGSDDYSRIRLSTSAGVTLLLSPTHLGRSFSIVFVLAPLWAGWEWGRQGFFLQVAVLGLSLLAGLLLCLRRGYSRGSATFSGAWFAGLWQFAYFLLTASEHVPLESWALAALMVLIGIVPLIIRFL